MEVVKALRASQTKSYRGLFDEAADIIEALVADLKHTERCELCDLCVNGQTPPRCAETPGDCPGECGACTYDCPCKNCRNSELFEWRGVQKRNEKERGGEGT